MHQNAGRYLFALAITNSLLVCAKHHIQIDVAKKDDFENLFFSGNKTLDQH